MHIAIRPWIIAGAMLAGAGVFAVTPQLASLPEVHQGAVALTAVDDPVTALDDVLQTASTNATTLYDDFAAAPFPALQQFIANFIGYAENYPGDAATIPADIADHLKNVTALLGPSAGGFLYSVLPGLADYQTLYQFAESPASGVVLGLAETSLNPLLALDDSYQDILSDLTGATPDTTAAFNEILDIPANVLDASLNGQFLDGTAPEIDLSSLVTAFGPLAPYHTLSGPELVLGGLLSPGGGSFLDALSYGGTYSPPCVPPGPCFDSGIEVTGTQIGPLGALETLAQDVAHALGWSGTGNPLDAAPDLSTLEGSDLSTALSSLPTEFNTFTTDLLTTLTGSL